jgi:hypothetical protein
MAAKNQWNTFYIKNQNGTETEEDLVKDGVDGEIRKVLITYTMKQTRYTNL